MGFVKHVVIALLFLAQPLLAEEIKYVPCSLEVKKVYNLQEDDSNRTILLYFRIQGEQSVENVWVNQWYLLTNKDGSTERYRNESRPHTLHGVDKNKGTLSAFVAFDSDVVKTIHLESLFVAQSAGSSPFVLFDSPEALILMHQIYPVQLVEPSPDINSDGIVNIQDFILFAEGFGASCGMLNFNSRMDFDRDGTIGIGDFLIFTEHFGKRV